MMPQAPGACLRTACVGLFIAVLGCGRAQQTISESEQNLAQLSRLYGVYLSKSTGKSPANLDALKAFARKTDPGELKARGVTATDVDSIFISSRDKQPFVYRPSAGGGVPGVGSEKVIFYEQTGVAGRRYVAYQTPGKVEEVDAGRFKELVPEAR